MAKKKWKQSEFKSEERKPDSAKPNYIDQFLKALNYDTNQRHPETKPKN